MPTVSLPYLNLPAEYSCAYVFPRAIRLRSVDLIVAYNRQSCMQSVPTVCILARAYKGAYLAAYTNTNRSQTPMLILKARAELPMSALRAPACLRGRPARRPAYARAARAHHHHLSRCLPTEIVLIQSSCSSQPHRKKKNYIRYIRTVEFELDRCVLGVWLGQPWSQSSGQTRKSRCHKIENRDSGKPFGATRPTRACL